MGFGASVQLNGQKLLKKTNDKCLAIAKELFVSIVNLSPSPINPGAFADGLLVNQWYPAIGSFSSELGASESDYGAESLARIAAISPVAFMGKDNMVTLSNNVHYAYRAEALGWPITPGTNWTGRVGPYLMVAKSLQAISARYR